MSPLAKDEQGNLPAYAWPGGYPIFYLDGQNSTLCPECANKSEKDPDEFDGWKPTASGINWEDPDMTCDHCSKRIQSAYAEDK